MQETISKAIEHIAKMSESEQNSADLLRLTQSALNLAHVLAVLKTHAIAEKGK